MPWWGCITLYFQQGTCSVCLCILYMTINYFWMLNFNDSLGSTSIWPKSENLIWVGSCGCGCLTTCFCYLMIAKPGNKTAALSGPEPYIHIGINEEVNTKLYLYCLEAVSSWSTIYCHSGLLLHNPSVEHLIKRVAKIDYIIIASAVAILWHWYVKLWQVIE